MNMQTVLIPKPIFMQWELLLKICMKKSESRTSLCFTDQEAQEEILLGGPAPFVGQVLHPSPVQSSRSIQHMNM